MLAKKQGVKNPCSKCKYWESETNKYGKCFLIKNTNNITWRTHTCKSFETNQKEEEINNKRLNQLFKKREYKNKLICMTCKFFDKGNIKSATMPGICNNKDSNKVEVFYSSVCDLHESK